MVIIRGIVIVGDRGLLYYPPSISRSSHVILTWTLSSIARCNMPTLTPIGFYYNIRLFPTWQFNGDHHTRT